ncbi:MAG: hypothetical protein ACK5WW_04125 [Brevundimonas sp.]|jgi:hypothetical protein|uniref:hypothetical protein n=2 Tax=Brevundimonas sp. TaxID=1871086 RepID=UPI0022C3CB48|nr:hypothetical protein [Brevundimonas sp.]MCZ8087007.1 hypothetical protein [Brevundimonas sp.]MCZ8193695.1 hypothetical protein [Brevundimonas sp.]
MKRRDLIAAAAVSAVAGPAMAGGPGGGGSSEPPMISLLSVGLPVIAEGRVRNYVFLGVRLHVAPNHNLAPLRLKEPYLRDALVKAAHRTPFTVAGDYSRLDPAAVNRVLTAAATSLLGRGVITRVEVVSQLPRRRVRPPAA